MFIIEKLTALGNIEINKEKEYALFSVNPKIYPVELVYSAAYIMIDKAYVILDGDPKEKVLVEIRKKENNQYLNLILLHKKDHKRIHLTKSLIIKSVRSGAKK